MIIYENTLGSFINSCQNRIIAQQVRKDMADFGIGSSESEIKAWENSLPEVADALNDKDIDKDICVAIEYKLVMSRQRIDFIVYGKDDDGRGNMVIIELKQWSKQVKDANKMFFVRTIGGGSFGEDKDYQHPSLQSYSYKAMLEGFNEYIQNNDVGIESCCYLHNLDSINDIVLSNIDKYPFVTQSPIFYQGDKTKLASFVKKYVKTSNRRLLYEIENSRIKPSKDFSRMMDEALKGNAMFALDQNQINSVATIVEQTLNSIENAKRKTIIIKGGPGCGKSVVALNALGQLLNHKPNRINACYTTPNFTPGEAFSEDLIDKDYKKVAIKNLIRKFASFSRADEKDFDCIIVDEGHRAFTWRFGQGVKRNIDMIDKIFYASKVNVFFIDEDQAIAQDDYLTIGIIKEYAAKYNSEVIENDELVLTSQFRCLGGDDYIDFINCLLGFDKSGFKKYKLNNRYEFKVFDSPSKMWDEIRYKQEKYKRSRLLAGYTHEWISKNDNSKFDFVFDNGEFKMQWNLNNCPIAYINDPDQWDRIGCIHTIQGVDMEYAGVIIGKDIIYRDGKIIFDKTQNAKTDERSGIRNASEEVAKKRIMNTYKVLLTRAIYGTFVYCEDKELNEFIKTLLIN